MNFSFTETLDPFSPGGTAPDFFADESGVGTIELVLILVVLISLVVIFRQSITSLLEIIFRDINTQSSGVLEDAAAVHID